MLSNQNRIQWIDTAKLLGIFLVILGHIPLDDSRIITVIYSFHMPLFFFLTGLTLKKEKISVALSKNMRSLLIPYLCFYLITYCWWLIVSFLRHPELFERNITVAVLKPFMGMLIGAGFDTKYSMNINAPLWFLVGLFLCKFLYLLTSNIFPKKKNNVFLLSLVILPFIAYFISFIPLEIRFIPFSFGPACMAYPFLLIGSLFQKELLSEKINLLKENKFVYLALTLLFFAITISLALYNGRIDVNTIVFGSNIFLFYINGFFGIGFIILLSNFLKTPKFLHLLEKNTIIILAFHCITTGLVVFALKKINMAFDRDQIVTALIVSFCSLLLNYFPIIIINKVFPFVIGRKKA